MDENSTIISLKGADRVRKRPAVIFGSDGIDGTIMAVKTIIDLLLTEAVLGHCSEINVVLHKDNSIGIKNYDRGFILDDTIIDGKPAWYYDFCELYSRPRDDSDSYNYDLGIPHNEIYGKPEKLPKYAPDSFDDFYLCCVQYVSRFMHVEATRDGFKKILDFERGMSVSELRKVQSTERSNTYIHFLLDSDVFDDIAIPSSSISSFLREVAITIPGLICSMCDERENVTHTFHYPKGAQDYITETLNLSMPLYIKEIEASGKDRYNKKSYDARVKILFSFVDNAKKLECFHNYRFLEYGGTHLNAIQEKIAEHVNWRFLSEFYNGSQMDPQERYDTRRKFEFSFEDLKKNVVLVIVSNCSKHATSYENATKKAIRNKMITDMASDLINDDFSYYLKQNHDNILAILKNIQEHKN